MVSGLVTSPELQERICLEEARPISMASKLLMSIKEILSSRFSVLSSQFRWREPGLLLVAFGDLFRGGLGIGLAVPVALGLAVDRLVVGLAVRGADPAEIDAQLLGGTEEVVVLLAQLGALALLGHHVDVQGQRLHL